MAFFGIDLDSFEFPRPADAAEARRRNVARLRPRACPFRLVRLGGDRDGAYLVPDDLEGIEACFSPGVARFKRFEDCLLDQFAINSYLCDHSTDVDSLQTPMVEGRQVFQKLALAAADGPGAITLGTWVGQHCPGGSDLVLQMDIEGAEYSTILATSRAVLQRFRVIVLELHGLAGFNMPRAMCQVFDPFFEKLTQDHVCVHVHPNNCSDQVDIEDTSYRIPKTLEVTLLRRDRIEGHPPERMIDPQLPHPRDILRNVGSRPPVFMDANWMDNQLRASINSDLLGDSA